MISLLLSLLISQSTFAISADPAFAMSANDRFKYIVLALRSTVALMPADGGRLCTGTLVSKNMVLTSAHCFDGHAKMEVNLMQDAFTVAKTIQIKRTHVHPLWKMGESALAKWNARLEPLYRDIVTISEATPEGCKLREKNWARTDLVKYLKRIENVKVARGADACEAAVPKLAAVLKRYPAKMLSDKPQDPNGPRPGDIAVVELSESVNDGFHQPMEIDFEFEPTAGDNRIAFISGFGLTSSEQKFERKILPFNQGYAVFQGMTTSDLMRVGESAVVCSGDSGGPTAYVQHGKMILVGVNAATDDCNFAKAKDGLSLSIRSHADWLLSIISK